MAQLMLSLAGACFGTLSLADEIPGLLFRVSADQGFVAEEAGGEAVPNFQFGVRTASEPAVGTGAIECADDGYVTWLAPGNVYAQRGTLSFFWRARYPVGEAPFVIFRVGFADHSSWDMAFLRIDWNGSGFDAFVTDANLARQRVSISLPQRPAPGQWVHLAFAWDEALGIALFVDGREVARGHDAADLDSGLDQFGMAGRVISPHQVQSRYNFMRGSDLDELRVYDRMLSGPEVLDLKEGDHRVVHVGTEPSATMSTWRHRFGWDAGNPPTLEGGTTRVRKVEFADARDLRQWMWKGVDGIPETTWPGVYNRSRLAGRDDYFPLPDWNVYVEGGWNYLLKVPAGERFNRVEIRGAAFGDLSYEAPGEAYAALGRRPEGRLRSVHAFEEKTGGTLQFSNAAQETPVQEIWAYHVSRGDEPAGTSRLEYVVRSGVATDYAALKPLNDYIAGRYPTAERSTVVALPAGPASGRVPPGRGRTEAGGSPIVHVLVPSGFGEAFPAQAVTRAWNYGWENAHDGLDGIALDLPALAPGGNHADGVIPLNLRVKDPIWPGRDMIDVSVSVPVGQPRTIWLDLRDRILTNDSLYLAIAAGDPDFGAEDLDGMKVRLIFKDRDAAMVEHVADRFNQVKDNWGFLVEEHTASKRASLYRRLFADISDLLRVAPDHLEGRRYWADISYGSLGFPLFKQPEAPAGVPLWAFRQLEDLGLLRKFVQWWIDERQVPYGDFGGGLSDDSDLTQQWPGLALMGVMPDKVNASLRALSDAVYANGMMEDGLGTITTDELHAYEEGLNSDAARLYLNWGEPKAVERMMATTHALTRVIAPNPAGHVHFLSNWFGARRIYREGPWEWQKPYSFSVMHTPTLLGVFNADPTAVGLVTSLADGWLAHGRQDESGRWNFPNEINWRSDQERKGDGGGASLPLQTAWAAFRFTGDDRYLLPVLNRLESRGPVSLSDINDNAIALLGLGDMPAASLLDGASNGSAFARYATWDRTGDRTWLEALHADGIEHKTQHLYMYTEGHWWSDRVALASDILQRERLGGVALWRNQHFPGHTVSWRFDDEGAAEEVALLLPAATPSRFSVIAYNTGSSEHGATMTAWNVTAGRWRVSLEGQAAREINLERSTSLDLVFVPGREMRFDFELLEPGVPTELRADIGIGVDDLTIGDDKVRIVIHGLGHVASPPGVVSLLDGEGLVRITRPIPPLAAPTDLLPKTVTVEVPLPEGGLAGWSVRLSLAKTPEVTLLNNLVQVPVP